MNREQALDEINKCNRMQLALCLVHAAGGEIRYNPNNPQPLVAFSFNIDPDTEEWVFKTIVLEDSDDKDQTTM